MTNCKTAGNKQWKGKHFVVMSAAASEANLMALVLSSF